MQQVDKNSDINKRLVQRLRRRLHRADPGGGNIFGGTSIGRQLTVILRRRRPEQPALLRSARARHSVPDAVQARRLVSAALRHPGERHLAGLSGHGRWHGASGCGVRPGHQPRPDTSLNVNYIVRSSRVESDRDAHAGQRHRAAARRRARSISSAGTRSTSGWRRSSRCGRSGCRGSSTCSTC